MTSTRARNLSVSLFAVPVLALAACGGGKSDKDKITDIIKQGGKDPSTICKHIEAKTLKALGGKDGCTKASKTPGAKDENIKVNSVDVKGDKATAKVKGNQGDQAIKFVKEGGDWKVTGTS